MTNKFNDIMAQRTDAELLKVLTTDRSSYEQDALEAARVEIDKRQLDSAQLKEAQETIDAEEKDQQARKNEPLGFGLKILTFLIPGLINIFIARTLKAEGYDRKWRDAWRWTFFGVSFYMAIAILISFLKR